MAENTEKNLPKDTKEALSKGKTQNSQATKEVTKKVEDFQGGNKPFDGIDPVKYTPTDTEDEKITLTTRVAGQEDIVYTGEVDDKFKERAKENIVGEDGEDNKIFHDRAKLKNNNKEVGLEMQGRYPIEKVDIKPNNVYSESVNLIKEVLGEIMGETEEDEFRVDGHYTVSNAGGYEIMIADSGDAAKVRDAYGSDNPETSDWLEIEYVDSEDGEVDEEGFPQTEPVIDPNGYNIPLNMVMRANRNESAQGLEEEESPEEFMKRVTVTVDKTPGDKEALKGFVKSFGHIIPRGDVVTMEEFAGLIEQTYDGNNPQVAEAISTINSFEDTYIAENDGKGVRLSKDSLVDIEIDEDVDSFIDNGGTDDEYLDSPEYFVETYYNGQFGQLREMLSEIDRTELINYLKELGENDIITWIATNSVVGEGKTWKDNKFGDDRSNKKEKLSKIEKERKSKKSLVGEESEADEEFIEEGKTWKDEKYGEDAEGKKEKFSKRKKERTYKNLQTESLEDYEIPKQGVLEIVKYVKEKIPEAFNELIEGIVTAIRANNDNAKTWLSIPKTVFDEFSTKTNIELNIETLTEDITNIEEGKDWRHNKDDEGKNSDKKKKQAKIDKERKSKKSLVGEELENSEIENVIDSIGTDNQVVVSKNSSGEEKIEVTEKEPMYESIKQLNFTNEGFSFKDEEHAKSLIPESYQVNGKVFNMTDGNQTFTFKWEQESFINEATLIDYINKSLIKENTDKVFHLMGYKTPTTSLNAESKKNEKGVFMEMFTELNKEDED